MAKLRGIDNLEKNTTGQQLLRVDGSNNTILSFTGSAINFTKEGTGALLQLVNPNILQFTAQAGTSYFIGTDSVDNSDNRTVTLSSSNTASATRGSFISVSGNEAAVNPSSIFITSGNAAASLVSITSSGASGTIQLLPANSLKTTFNSLGLEYNNSYNIYASSSDGADNQSISIAAGGSNSTTRGGYIAMHGNEVAVVGGAITLVPGNITSGNIVAYIMHSSAQFNIRNSSDQTILGLNSSSNLFFGVADAIIRQNTADAADDRLITIAGGGSNAADRGAQLTVHGNEHANLGGVILQTGSAVGGNLLLSLNNSTGLLHHRFNGVNRWTWNDAGEEIFNATNTLIRADTSDGADTKQISITGGGGVGDHRGASIQVAGNEHNSSGDVRINSGGVGAIYLQGYGTGGIHFRADAVTRWQMVKAGHLIPAVTNSYDIGSASFVVRDLYVNNLIGPISGGSLSTLANDTFLNARNFANIANVGLIKLSTNDDTIINSASNKTIKLCNVAGSGYIGTFDYTDQSLTLAATAGNTRIRQTAATIDSRWTLDVSNSRIIIGTTSSHDVHFNTNNLNRWYIDTTGRLAENTTNGNGILLQNPTSGIEYNNASGDLYFGSATASDIRFYTNNNNRWRIKSSGDLEQDATNGGFLDFTRTNVGIRGPTAGVLSLNLGASSGTLSVKNSVGVDLWSVLSSGNLEPGTNISHDIGTSSKRIRKIFVDRVDDNTFADNEIPSGLTNGINTVYETAFSFISTSLKVYYNGLRQIPGASSDFTVTGVSQFTMNFAPIAGDTLLIDYRKD